MLPPCSRRQRITVRHEFSECCSNSKGELPQLYAREPGVGLEDVMSSPSLQAMPRCTDRPLPACQGTRTAIYQAGFLPSLHVLPAVSPQTIVSPCLLADPVPWLAQNGIRTCGFLQITSGKSRHRNRNQLCGVALPSAAGSILLGSHQEL